MTPTIAQMHEHLNSAEWNEFRYYCNLSSRKPLTHNHKARYYLLIELVQERMNETPKLLV
jgi:hypothetical protein